MGVCVLACSAVTPSCKPAGPVPHGTSPELLSHVLALLNHDVLKGLLGPPTHRGDVMNEAILLGTLERIVRALEAQVALQRQALLRLGWLPEDAPDRDAKEAER